ncbi:GumC family protein [Desulfonema magnum]|uniref:Polysaccharide chain length determinant protein domain-containing protein n=1 Tax=Desulfonema magnum TaxID=45655 RepID=A0A975BQT7_9BACT|nr:Wzz/FepE/Etk N-terminal domain-containing protein [Desulfonema magnum]QTA89986.1 Polysaccharide chain length determinant protein domain-containing protein [Desulfonema magnum]
MEANEMTLNDYVDAVKRRKWSIILPAFIVFSVAAAVAMMLPSVFKSTATILIEGQEIPSDFVMATVTSYVEQRLQSINQRIMSTSRLSEMISRFGLYKDLQGRWTTEEIIEKMREDIMLNTISTEVMDRRTGRAMSATIAFTLSYEGKSPTKVQQVTNMLASLYLEENLQVRKRQTKETSLFLEDEMEKVKTDLATIEKNISDFKKEHINELPEMLQLNIQGLNNIERNIERLEEQLRSLKEREGYLQTQLASIPPELDQDKNRLEELKIQLIYLRSQFSDEYPDVIKTANEIAELEKKMGELPGISDAENDRPDNPAYITLASQLASTRADLKSVKQQIRKLERNMDEYRGRIEATPKLEEQYNEFVMERNNTHAKLNDLMRKLMEAKVAYGLEEGQKGERFTLIDPPGLPEKPFKPNRKAIILIGVVLGMGAGAGIGALKEFTDPSVRNAGTLVAATSFPVLASIPVIVTKRDRNIIRIKRIILMIGVILVIAAGVAAFHYLVMDLDIFRAKVARLLDKHQILPEVVMEMIRP